MGENRSQSGGAQQQAANDLPDDTWLMEPSKQVAATVSCGQQQYQGEEKMRSVSVSETQSATRLAIGGNDSLHSFERSTALFGRSAFSRIQRTLPTVPAHAGFSMPATQAPAPP
jgi:hypothetical protein